ncbi:MAG: hypothetical protein WD029_09365, partial [Microthrixaceae bacterium]
MAESRKSTTKILVGVICAAAVLLIALVLVALRQQGIQQPENSQSTVIPSSTDVTATLPNQAETTVAPNSTVLVAVDVVDHVIRMGLIQREYLTVAPADLGPEEK